MTIEERQEAAKWFQNRASHTTMPGAKMMFKRAAEALSEGMQPHWIPCSERLPEDSNFYIVTHKDFSVGFIWYSAFHGWEWQENPIAWMPLPKPYGGESE